MDISPPAKGWYVEVDLPSGETVQPEVAGSPSRNPAVNGYPRLSIPVRKRQMWQGLDLKNNTIPIRVWYNAQRQPIDELEDIEETEGATQVLKGRGGTELENIYRNKIDAKEAHLVAEDVIQTATSYQANVDAPPSTIEENVQLHSADTQADFQGFFEKAEPYSPVIAASDLSNGDGEGLRLSKTCRVRETNAIGDKSVSNLISDSNSSDDDAVNLDTSGDYVEMDWNPSYTVPSGEMEAAFRIRFPDDPDNDGNYETPEIRYYIDGEHRGGWADNGQTSSDSYGWDTADAPNADRDSVTVRIECESNPQNASCWVDLIAVYDRRYHDSGNFDNDVSDSSGYLDSPTEYATGNGGKQLPTRDFEAVSQVRSVVGGRAELTVDDVSGVQEIALSNDRGQNYLRSGSGVDTFEDDFADTGPSLKLQLTLKGYGSRTDATPTQGFKTPQIDASVLKADLDDTPLVVDQKFDEPARDVLTAIAEDLTDSLWEVRIHADGTWSVEWAEPKQRTTDRQEPITSFESTETVAEIVGEVTVKGSGQRVRGEEFTADHNTWVDLDNDYVQKGKEAVYDPNTGEQFVEKTDYQLDGLDGRIKVLSNGDMTDGQTYKVDYAHQPTDTYTLSNAPATARTIKPEFPQLPTPRACGQVARLLGGQLDDPLKEGIVTIPSDKAGWSVIEAVAFDELPFDEHLEVRDVENTPEQTVLRLGSRKTVGETIADIRTRLDALASRS
jgi:hypothetical protein